MLFGGTLAYNGSDMGVAVNKYVCIICMIEINKYRECSAARAA